MALSTFENTSASDFIPSRIDASWSPSTELYTLKAAILEVVENQIRNSVPPEARQTLEGLLVAKYSGKQAIEMFGSVLVEEVWAILHDPKPFDRARFTGLLEQLG